jgi:SAM-dependent methyltransferase
VTAAPRWAAQILVGDDDGPRVLQLIERAAAVGAGAVQLSGHHLFTRAELLPWAAKASSLGLDLQLATDGPLPVPAGRVDRLSRLGLRAVVLAMAQVADEGYPAIAPLLSPRIQLTVEQQVAGADESAMRAMVDWLLPLPGITLRFALTDGGADAVSAIAGAIAYGRARIEALGEGPRLTHRGAALCLMADLADRRDDDRDRAIGWSAPVGAVELGGVGDGNMARPAVCAGCASAGGCPGLHEKHQGDATRLRPRSDGMRSNSFTFRAEQVLAKLDKGACPIYSAPGAWDRARHLLLDDDAQVIVHRAASRDFTDRTVVEVKHRLGQVYLDRSDKPAPDDFARDLAKLTIAEQCRTCDRQTSCTCTYSIVDGDLFTLADERVRTQIAGIASRGGRVVDVGCGDGRYGDLWEPAASGGALRYLGIEPEEARASALAARWPWAEIAPFPVEKWAIEGGIDALLVLRSWNHLADPARALGKLVAALRPGGTCLIADNVAFGLVRSAEQTARAESPSSGARFEHYRNDSSTEALAALASLPLELVHHDPVTPDGSNQWLLVLAKR